MKASAQRGTARSLRLKLTLWFLTFSSILHALLLVAVVSFRRDIVHRSNQRRVESWARAMVDNILVAKPTWSGEEIAKLRPFDARFELLVVRDAGGVVLVSWPDERGGENVPFTTNESVPAGPLGAVFSKVIGERASALVPGESRVEILTLPFRDVDPFYLQVGVKEAEIEGVLRPFLDFFLLGVPLASLAALAAAWMISGRAVQPLLRLSRAARDVSPSRLGERILLESTDQEVSALQRELNSALERLESGYRAQEEFISNVSHELRTPIAVLRSQSQLLLEGEQPLESHQAFVASVEEETQRLGRLVESFLALASRPWSRAETDQEVDAIDIVLDTVRYATPAADKQGVRLTSQINSHEPEADAPVVSGDPALLETMLENLVRNAIRFAPQGSAVLIQASATPEHVLFRVRDHGPGIPEPMLERVFDRFVRWSGPSGGRGAGIGLAIAREVAELHGGSITAANAQDGGAVFSVVLPRVRGRAGANRGE